jgi:hypothetical protein
MRGTKDRQGEAYLELGLKSANMAAYALKAACIHSLKAAYALKALCIHSLKAAYALKA